MKIRLLCNSTSSEDLVHLWEKMLDPRLGIELTSEFSREVDVYIIINCPPPGDTRFVPGKTIVVQMESHMKDHPEIWGEDWRCPNKDNFIDVRDHQARFNTIEWHLSLSYEMVRHFPFDVMGKKDAVSVILSDKYVDPGHKLRLDFVKYMIQENEESKEPVELDVFGTSEYTNMSTKLPMYEMDKGVLPYKYHLAVENHNYKNYATEKIWNGILAGCLVFYWGCPNLGNFLPKDSFVVLPLDESFETCRTIIQECMDTNQWEKRIKVIRRARKLILRNTIFHSIT